MKTLQNVKLGNMRKPVDWTVYPHKPEDTKIIIQSEKRIAEIDLVTKTATLSNGKGFPGFIALSFDTTTVEVPDEVIQKLQRENKQERK